MSEYLLPSEAYAVVSAEGDLDFPFWEGTKQNEIRIQRCTACGRFQWGPEFLCHHCQSFDLTFEVVAPTGTVFSWERVWHPISPAYTPYVPYVVVMVELDEVPGIYLLGNLIGDQKAEVPIGAPVVAEFEHHDEYTLVQWRVAAEG